MRSYADYARAVAGERLPLAFIDLDLLDANANALTTRAAGLPLRLATKSLRCVQMLRHLLQTSKGFRGLMAYSPAEAVFLAEQGFDDILIGYPSVEPSELTPCLRLIAQGAWICFMVDDPRQVSMLEALARAQAGAGSSVKVPICIDLDMSTDLPGLRFGVYRSPLRTLRSAEPLLAALRLAPHLELQAVMGYEAQLAGIADAVPGAGVTNSVIRLLKHLSQPRVFKRRQEFVKALQDRGVALRLVNGGGTGSLERTKQDGSVTEITVGSGFYSPALFDHYREFSYLPAAGFALPVVRQAAPDVYACAGGGYVASGPSGQDKQPIPYLPQGIEVIKTLGAGEVQTSVRSPLPLDLGAPVFFRHAKAGELFERFNQVYLLRGGAIAEVVPTYRGQGACFF